MSEAKDRRDEFSISSIHFGDRGEWRITQRKRSYFTHDDPIVWSAEFHQEDWGDPSGYPERVRKAFEELIGYSPDAVSPEPFNVVELMAAGDEDGGPDQPCVYGNRVSGHAVYCHNQSWLYAPRKCRRTKHDPKWAHALCPGFRANPNSDPEKSW